MSNLEELKKKTYGKMALCGAVDTQHILPYGTPEEVGAEVRRVIEILAPGGGFMVASVHTVMHEVPPENILAMVDAVEKYGKY
jgi:uroporphyrinogen decarboxylase